MSTATIATILLLGVFLVLVFLRVPWYMPLVWLLCWISSIWASTPCRWL